MIKEPYICDKCGYVYGDGSGNATAPGVSFQSLADDWTCPRCGASKEEFSKEFHGGLSIFRSN